MPEPPYPLHESVKSLLAPEYVAFYNKHTINQQQVHLQDVATSRISGLPIGAGPQQPVGGIKDYGLERRESRGPPVMVRVFTPEGQAPEGGWPVAIYYHGGGWVLGDIGTENVVCSHICSRAACVVVSVDYRLAPEHPFPAAVHDSWEAVLWTHTTLATLLPVNTSKVAIGGSSAGGNLAAIMTQKSTTTTSGANMPPFVFQYLMVPVTDNTALPSNSPTYRSYEFTPALPAEKMLWYRRHYLPDPATWAHPDASPLFWQGEWGLLAPALVVLGELDVLRGEGERFAERLANAGVEVRVRVMLGMPHPFLAMDGVLEAGREAITAICESLVRAFGV